MTTILVTHDQEEAMEVADQLAVFRHGRLEQVGSPTELYDRPSPEFVLTFLGPATRIQERLVRPHDLVLHRQPGAGRMVATVERITHLGFEVRVELAVEGSESAWAQLSRVAATSLGLSPGDQVWVEAHVPDRLKMTVTAPGSSEREDPAPQLAESTASLAS